MVVRIIMVNFVVGLFIFSGDLDKSVIIVLFIILVIILEKRGVLEVKVIFKYKGMVIRNMINLVGKFDFNFENSLVFCLFMIVGF